VRSTDRFPQALRNWRRQAGVSQADLDTLLGRSAGTVAQFEVGRLKPPDRATCAAIAAALGVAEVEVWTIARDERLRLAAELLNTFDPTDADVINIITTVLIIIVVPMMRMQMDP
jgi:transcriptional regulator with XRE-family HTH domain